jgi:hypothetical protein
VILALVAAALLPFAVGADADIASLADMAKQCGAGEAVIGRLDGSPALYLDATALYSDLAKGQCLFGRISGHKFSSHFGFVGNASRE